MMVTDLTFETVSLASLEKRGLTTSNDLYRPLVLVVDDERIIADTRTAILKRWGYAVLTAYDAESALEIARLIPPELLVSDVMLGRTNGVNLAIAMRNLVPDCKVILFTGRSDSYDLLAKALPGDSAFTVLSKPMHPAQLWTHLAGMNFDGSMQFVNSVTN